MQQNLNSGSNSDLARGMSGVCDDIYGLLKQTTKAAGL